MNEALKEEPNEIEFKLAISENAHTINEKKNRVIELKRNLAVIDPAYYLEHYKHSDYNNVLEIDAINGETLSNQEEGMYI